MSYSYSTPLSYGTQAPLTYDDTQNQQNAVRRRPSSLPMGVAGATVGIIGGSIVGLNKNPYMSNGVPTDKFAKCAFDKYIKKAPEDEKKAYNQYNEVIKKINKVKTVDELKTLLNDNPEASKEVSTALGSTTTEEYLNTITDSNLASNKETIKKKLEAGNQTRFQKMKNDIASCWNSEKKKFEQPTGMDDNIFKAIKKTSGKIRSGFIAKYALITGAITGAVSFIAHKIYVHKKETSQQQ